jgi:hypothetical protein
VRVSIHFLHVAQSHSKEVGLQDQVRLWEACKATILICWFNNSK